MATWRVSVKLFDFGFAVGAKKYKFPGIPRRWKRQRKACMPFARNRRPIVPAASRRVGRRRDQLQNLGIQRIKDDPIARPTIEATITGRRLPRGPDPAGRIRHLLV